MSRPRIIGGTARGRELETPARGTRPSPARLREALFDILAFEERGRFLDLFAGSGAIGLEAVSRGWRATCVELSRDAAAVIRRNARALTLEVDVVEGDAIAYAAANPARFEVVFAAPPYPLDLDAVFTAVLRSRAAGHGGLYVLQHPSDHSVGVPNLDAGHGDGARLLAPRVKRYGSNALTLLRVAPPG